MIFEGKYNMYPLKISSRRGKLRVEFTISEISIFEVISSCAPLGSLASSDTGDQACAKEDKICMFGTIYRIMVDKTDENTIIPGHSLTIDCDTTMAERMSMDEIPSTASIDYDPAWICCG